LSVKGKQSNAFCLSGKKPYVQNEKLDLSSAFLDTRNIDMNELGEITWPVANCRI
jgi:hypothetical protein